VAIVEKREEIQVKVLFGREKYILLNREEQWELALSEGYTFSPLRGKFRKAVII